MRLPRERPMASWKAPPFRLPAELNLIKAGTKFKSLPQSARVASEVTIHVGDVNQQIYGAALKEHFEKTMRGLETVLVPLGRSVE